MVGTACPVAPRPSLVSDDAGGDAAPNAQAELTTVAEDEAVFHRGEAAIVHDGLEPDTEYTFHGVAFRTLPRPPGERLATFATVNDVHFGEVECGLLDGIDIGPVLRVEPGKDPYPETMNRGAVAEISAIDPAAVVAKGDLTTHGTVEEFESFLACYGPAFGDRLHYVRGNHDAASGADFASDAPFSVPLPGVTLAVLDTVIPGAANGQVSADQLAWLDDLAADSDQPILVFGHHHPWKPGSATREPGYFGILPDDAEKLVEVVARRPVIAGYFAGHTHRNRVRRFAETADVPWVEVACVKDFPGAWAEYRVYEGGIVQVHRRISTPEALHWTERTRAMFAGFYPQYAFGTLADRCFVVGVNARRL
ncbi:MAG: 3,5-cyclic-AMP phosphodiesterase [Acidimicrobiaceae bacterium]|nr:3,5-cyclic-AMP phosphodiesterase [Acidimicrobiaceae bacterium]